MARVGLKEVSRHAGVSVSTVSHILSGRASRYAAETQETVLHTAKKLGYHSNHLARSLRHRKTFSIGLIVPEFFFRLDRIERMASDRGYRVQMAAHHGEREQNQSVIADLVSRQVDGLLIIYPEIADADARKLIADVPTVAVDVVRRSFGCSLVDQISRSARIATEHLLSLGHRKTIYLGPGTNTGYGRERILGYAQALMDHGIESSPERIITLPDTGYPSTTSEEVMSRVIESWKGASRPTAMVASNCEVAVGVIASLKRAGIDVPRDFSVVSTMDQTWGRYTAVPITAVDDRHRQIIEDAMTLLLDRIDAKEFAADLPDYPPTIVRRASCATIGES